MKSIWNYDILGFYGIVKHEWNYVILWYAMGSRSHFFWAFWGWMCWVERGMTSAAISLYSFCRNKFTQQGSDVQGDDEDEGWSNFPASHQILSHPGSSSSVVNHRRCGSFSGCHTRYQQLHWPWTQLGGPGPRWRLLGDLLQVDAGDVKVTHLKSLISPWKMMRYHCNLLHIDTRSERFTLSFFSFLLGFSFLHQIKVTCHSVSSYLFKICLGPKWVECVNCISPGRAMVEEHHQDEGEQSIKFQQFEQWSCVDESWSHAKMNFGVAKHSREFPEVKTSNETSHLQMPFYIHLSGDPLFSQFYFPHLPGLVEGCAVRWGCRDGLQGLPLNGFHHPPFVESEHRIVCRLAWQGAFCPTMVADSWTPAALALRWGMGEIWWSKLRV